MKKYNFLFRVFTSLLIFLMFIFVSAAFSSSALAAPGINKQLGYQGVLKNPNGNTIPNASYDMVFKIYNVSSGGTPLWTGTYTATNSNPVTTNNGFFHVLLGSGTGNALNLDFNDDSYYLGITVGSDAEMSPRQRIGATGYAFNADMLDGLSSTALIVNGDVSGTLGATIISDASSTTRGLMTTGAQTFAGNKTFNGNLSFNNSSATINNVATNGAITIQPNGTGALTLLGGSGGGSLNLGTGSDATGGILFGSENNDIIIQGIPSLFSLGSLTSGGLVHKSELRFLEPSFVNGTPTLGSNYLAFQVPITDLATTTVWTLPAGDGTNGQVLSTNGSGALSWTAALSNSLANGKIFVGNASNTAAAVALSGDATLANTGALTILSGAVNSSKIADDSIVNADINSSAAIALSKLANGSSIVTSLTTPTGSNANGGSIASNVLALSLADATNPGLVSTGTQTFAGSKTFSSAPIISPMTSGSVLFAGASGLVSQNNAGLFWDNTNSRLGIGTTNPTAGLEVTPTNTAGTQWALRSGADFGNKSVVYGNGIFVSVADTNALFTSPDGITWTQRSIPTASIWRAVTYGNAQFVAVGSVGGIGTVMTSPDGITWTNRTPAANNDWQSVAYANGTFVAVASSGTGNRVMTSPDGITWTSRTSASNDAWRGVTFGNGLFVAVSFLGSTYGAMTSPDGITWTGRTTPSEAFNDVAFGGGLFVAVSEGGATGVATSPDGITWTSRTPAASLFWRGVTYGNGIFVAVAGSGTGNRVMISPDGTTWTSRTSAADNNWNGIAFGNNLFVVVADSGTTRVMTSSGALPTAIAANGSVSAGGNIMPTSNAAFDLGSATNKWRDMYLSGNTSIGGTLNVTGASTLATTTANSLTLSPMTTGSLLFAGAGGLVSQNNAGLFWDNTNSRLGIGTTTPSTTLAVNGTFDVTEPAVPISATGGTITTSGTYTIHTFTSSGTFTPNGAVSVEYLVVAGGGAGGAASGAGGGAGGVLSGTTTISGATTVTVGAGGSGGSGTGASGSNSVLGSVTATGGGGGGSNAGSVNGVNGGSGGGATGATTATAGTGISGQGFAGGTITSWSGAFQAAGGGGAGAVGGSGNGTAGTGAGGVGLSSSISGTATFYSGGGGGGSNSGGGSVGGNGGGGHGGNTSVAGTANTGGGGGGGGGGGEAGASGGSGVVIVRYLTSSVTSTIAALHVVSSGNVGIGTTTPTAQLHTTGTVRFQNFGAGTLTTDASGNVTVSSDVRLKEVQSGFTRGLADLKGLTPINYNWTEASGLDTQHTYTGFAAQNVLEFVPEAVSESNGLLTLSDRPILAAAVNAIKELDNTVSIQGLQLGKVAGLVGVTQEDLDATRDQYLSGVKAEQDAKYEKLAAQWNALRQEYQKQLTSNSTESTSSANTTADNANSLNLAEKSLNELEKKGVISYYENITVHGDSIFEKLTTFIGDVFFRGRVIFEDKDVAGEAEILAGDTQVTVTFERAYTVKPLVNATVVDAQAYDAGFSIADVTEKGFTIRLTKSHDKDILFNWATVAVKDAKRYKSVGKSSAPSATPSPTSTPTPQPSPSPTATAGAATPTGTAQPEPSPTPTETPEATVSPAPVEPTPTVMP